jgi:hypothetical protein
MALASYPKIDFGSRLAVIREVCEELGLPSNQVPDQSGANSIRTYLKYINYCNAALSLPLLLSLDYHDFNSAINAIAVAAGAAKPEIVTAPYASSNATPPIVNSILSCTTGTWLNAGGATYTYQWLRDGVVIAGQTAATHTVVSADTGGHELSCAVVATTGAGASTPSTSNIVMVP